MGSLASSLLPPHDIWFAHEHKELALSIEGDTMTALTKPSFDVNVTTYCLAELRLQIFGEYVALGIPTGKVKGSDMTDKVDSINW